jgi:hypothetical protein
MGFHPIPHIMKYVTRPDGRFAVILHVGGKGGGEWLGDRFDVLLVSHLMGVRRFTPTELIVRNRPDGLFYGRIFDYLDELVVAWIPPGIHYRVVSHEGNEAVEYMYDAGHTCVPSNDLVDNCVCIAVTADE